MTAEQLSYDLADQLRLRAQLESATRDKLTWKAIAVEAIHMGAELHNRIGILERHVAEMREERDRIARRVFADAPLREQP